MNILKEDDDYEDMRIEALTQLHENLVNFANPKTPLQLDC